MFNKNKLFISISILVGFVISYYYNKIINTNFILMFITTSIILYILFYYLGNIRESYTDYYNHQLYESNDSSYPKINSLNNENTNTNYKLGNSLYSFLEYMKNQLEAEEEEDKEYQRMYKQETKTNSKLSDSLYSFTKYIKKLESEEEDKDYHKMYNGKKKSSINDKLGNSLNSLFGYMKKQLQEEEGEKQTKINDKLGDSLNSFLDYMKKLEEEEEVSEENKSEEENKTEEENKSEEEDKANNSSLSFLDYMKKLDECKKELKEKKNKEDSTNYQKPDINKLVMSSPTPSSPFNINISYNSQNSINELDNDKESSHKENIRKNNSNHNLQSNDSKNLGKVGDNTRVYNNSDWIYGDSAWTNNPDYYIPEEVRIIPQKPLNEWAKTMQQKGKTVCPLMNNMPWSEYKSGDSDPEAYNL